MGAIWTGLVAVAVLAAAVNGRMGEVTRAALSSATEAGTYALGLAGGLALWLGLMKVAEEAGIVRAVARAARPLLVRLFPDVPPDDPAMEEGHRYLMQNLPPANPKNCYYGFHATQVLHNLGGADWDTWNRQMRRTLIDSQVKEGCAAGSWDPDGAGAAEPSGRVMVTSLNCLTKARR